MFDRRRGVDTAGVVPVGTGTLSGISAEQSNRYEATPRSVFCAMMRELGRSACSGWTFVDIGSGKGAVVLYASEYPFRAVIGVEASPELHQTALANVARSAERQCCDKVTAVCADALQWPLPAGPTMLYLYNPFPPTVTARFLGQVRESFVTDPRPLRIMARLAPGDQQLEDQTWLTLRACGRTWAIYETS